MQSKIAVIGAGLAGLAAAIRLAAKDYQVSVFEKNNQAGGKLNAMQRGEFYFDIGPTLLTMPFVIDELFESVGKQRSDYLNFKKLDIICKYFFSNGKIFKAYQDKNKIKEELANIFPVDYDNYFKYLAYSQRIYELTSDIFLFNRFDNYKDLFIKKNFKTLFNINQIDSFRTIHEANSTFFKSEELIQLFDRYATYSGSNPFAASATLNLIPHVEYTLGSYYVEGGIYKLTETLLKLAGEFGIECHYNSQVEEIIIKNKTAVGLKIKNEVVHFDKVISNADVVTTYSTLIKQSNMLQKKLEKLEPSLSAMIFLWSVNKNYPELEHHNIFFSEDYKKEFSELFNELIPASDPTVYLAISSKTDMNHAPQNSMNVFCLINMPYLNKEIDWSDEAQRTKARIFQKLAKFGVDFSSKITDEEVITPEKLYSMYLSNKGSIYGISSNNKYTAFLRPNNKAKEIKNLFFCGGSSHPGGGIPLVILSGKNVAEIICDNR